MSLFNEVVCVILALIAIVWVFFKWTFSYWKRKGVPYLEPSIPFGNAGDIILQKSLFFEIISKCHRKIKALGLKYAGIYLFIKPVFVVVDPELIKHILQKDFEYFTDRGMYFDEKLDPLSANLFSLDGPKWKKLRVKLTPTFTSNKMKLMFNILKDTTKPLHPILQEHVINEKPVDIKDLLARFTTDVISSCAFGLESSCLKDPDSEFREYGKRVFSHGLMNGLKNFMSFVVPISWLKAMHVRRTRLDVQQFFMNVVKSNIEYRKSSKITRGDFFQLLLQIQDEDPSFNFETFAAQCYIFFVAGFETSSSAMSFTLYELSLNEEIQDKLRAEIKTVVAKHDNEVSYDALMEMTYLDQVLNETLRKYPTLPFLFRRITKKYKIPDDSDVFLDYDTTVFISAYAIHHDPEYYPNPELYDPERFNVENKSKRSTFLHMPFGEGPRNCIGSRFGLMQAKMGLVALLTKYKFTLNEKTETPLKMSPSTLVLSPLNTIWLNVKEL